MARGIMKNTKKMTSCCVTSTWLSDGRQLFSKLIVGGMTLSGITVMKYASGIAVTMATTHMPNRATRVFIRGRKSDIGWHIPRYRSMPMVVRVSTDTSTDTFYKKIKLSTFYVTWRLFIFYRLNNYTESFENMYW